MEKLTVNILSSKLYLRLLSVNVGHTSTEALMITSYSATVSTAIIFYETDVRLLLRGTYLLNFLYRHAYIRPT